VALNVQTAVVRAGGRGRAVWPLVRHAIRTTPWVTLISGSLAGTAILAALAYLAHRYHSPLGQNAVRLTFLPACATVAFAPRTVFRPLTGATPVPAWPAAAMQMVLAFAVLAATCWAQLSLLNYTFARPAAEPAIYPLIAGLTGWSAIFVAAAACCDRSRFADLGGAVAAPAGFVVIALAWYGPKVSALFVTPPASLRAATIAWYLLAAGALAVAYAATRDRWLRYTRGLARHRPDRRPRHAAKRRADDVNLSDY
jgi:hypothetical protein